MEKKFLLKFSEGGLFVRNKKLVVAAMSGGVDSSVTAALLLEQGYEVIGVTMQIWDPGQTEAGGEFVGCCSLSAVDDARSVADKLGINYYVLNFRPAFQELVIDDFVTQYLSGRTPNPCVVCNRRIKFEALLDKALRLGAEFIATGHYARLEFDEQFNRYVIKKALDVHKDQTYFLYAMTQQQIAHTLMPLGGYTKEQVREMAAERGLSVAEKPESQEICFVTDNDYHSFIREHASTDIKPGPFLDLEGNVLGQHKGIPFYTIGQRRGLGLATGEKIYVIDIDPQKNAIIVGPPAALECSELLAGDNNIILYDRLDQALEVQAQIRYNSKPAPAKLFPSPGGVWRVVFDSPQKAVTPGQAVVYYQGDYLVGGGTIIKRL